MNCIKKAFGSHLKSLRKSRNLTQEELAEKIGVNIRQLARIEVGESFVTADTLYNICSVLNVSPSVLFDFSINNQEFTIHAKDELKSHSYKILNKKIFSISDNDKKLEFMNMAFDSLSDKKSLEKLKILIKGIELTL